MGTVLEYYVVAIVLHMHWALSYFCFNPVAASTLHKALWEQWF